MSEHHPRGMSKWPSILACARYESAAGGANAELGSKTHAFLADILNEYKLTSKVPKLDADAAFFDAGAYRAARIIIDCSVASNVRPEDIHVEERVTLEDGVFGTADCWYANATTVCVWDFKTAYNPGRDYIPQLAGYALAIRQQMELAGVAHPPYEFNLRTIYGDTSKVDGGVYDIVDLQHLYERVKLAFDDKDAAPTQCNWCELCAKFTACPACTAVASQVQETLADAPMMWETYTPAKKAQVMLLAEFLGKWAEEVKKAAKQTLLNGGAVADEAIGAAWKVKYDRAKIKINTAVACKALIDKGVDVNKIRARLTLSKDDVEELAKTVGLKGKKRTEFIETLGTRGCDVAKIERM